MSAVCPGAAPTSNNPVTLVGVTQTPNVPNDIFSANGTDPFPSVAWTPTDQFCSFGYKFTPGHEFIVPVQDVNLTWRDSDNTINNDTTGSAPGAGLCTGLGSTVGSSTQITGPVSSGFIPYGTAGNSVQVTIVSGTVRVGMSNGSLFGYQPGDPVSNAVILYEWAAPVNSLRHDYFDHGTDETPTGYTDYITSLAAPSQTAQCDPATGITDTAATLNATLLVNPTDQVRWRYGTTPGGPYGTTLGPIPAVDGSGNNIGVGGLTPNTQYYFVVDVLDAGNVVQATSGECTFTTTAPGAPILSNCSIAAKGRNGIEVFYDIDTANGGLNDADFNNVEGEYSIDGGGTWLPVPTPNDSLTPSGDILVPTQFTSSGEVVWPLLAGQSVMYRVNFMVNSVLKESLTCGPVNTSDYPTIDCEQVANITTTSADINIDANNFPTGQFNSYPAGVNDPQNIDTLRVVYGTTPGGPYPFTQTAPAAGSVGGTVSLAGLTPNTQYYYRIQADEQFQTGTQFLDVGECTFTTLANISVQSQPATNITSTTADANGLGNNIPVNEFIRISYGPTGGPYTNIGPNVPGTNVPGQPITRPLAGLTPNTQYCTVTERIAADGTTVLDTSTESCFTTLAAPVIPPDCSPATNITPTSADLNGVLHGATPGDLYNFEFGLVSGGPYPFQTAPQGVAVGGDPEPISQNSGILPPGSTIYFRVQQRDSGNNPKAFSGECSFVTPLAPTANCVAAQNITETSADLQVLITSGDNPGWNYVIHIGTTPGGPYATATLGPFPVTTDPQGEFQPTGNILTQGTTYYWIVELRDGGNVVQATSSECNFQTIINPASVTTDPPSGQTANCVTLNGTSTDAAAGNCTYSFIWGTTPGGPYPNTVNGTPFVATGASPEAFSAQVCGLNPGQTIYYKAQVKCGDDPVIQGDEVPATTTQIIIDPCEPATNVTPVSATLHGTSNGVPAGYSYQFRYGTTPGGPYPNVVSGGPSSGASPDPYQANVVGLTPCTTYYYTSEVLNPQQQVVAGGGECTFTSDCSAGPGGFVYWCGSLYDSADCIFVPDNWGSFYGDDGNPSGYYNCSFADPIDE